MLRQLFFFVQIIILMSTLALVVTAQDSDLSEMMIADHEQGVQHIKLESADVGFVAWGDSQGNTILGITQVAPSSNLAIPGTEGFNQVLRIDYNISAWGGFTHAFTDGEVWIGQNWLDYNAMQFWLYGNNTGGTVQIDIFDNRAPDSQSDTAERWFYRITDDYDGWQQFTIPFTVFQRRTDFQPTGAPDDGFNLDAVSGYAFVLPSGVGAQTTYLDNVQLVITDSEEVVGFIPETEVSPEIEIDMSIDWDSREWELLWSDEFDAASSAPINEEFWTCEEGDGSPELPGWGNNELEFYTSRTENVVHDGNGNLVITAREETLADSTCWYGECQYTSARCITQDKVEFTYGRVEARIKIPTGQGIWPAFWMLGANIDEVSWPNSGEIDILENVGNEPNTVHGTIHGPGYSAGNGIQVSLDSDTAFTENFHIYAIDWDPNVIRWYVDGELYGIISANDMMNTDWVFDQDFFLLMNLAVGGNWPGHPDETTEFPQEMLIDYIRVYQLSSE